MKIEGFVPSAVAPTEALGRLSFASWLKTFMPSSLMAPFVNNEILLIALMALVTGLALRQLGQNRGESYLQGLAEKCERWRALPGVWLTWLIALIPLAVAAVVAGAVSEFGLSIFAALFRYVGVVILGFILQIVIVYGFWVIRRGTLQLAGFLASCASACSLCLRCQFQPGDLAAHIEGIKGSGRVRKLGFSGSGSGHKFEQ